MHFKKRGQAALEFLMTYGWVILIVLVVIGSLVYFGILSPSTILGSKCILQMGLYCKDHKVDSDSRMIFLELRNTKGKGILINQVNITGNALGEKGCLLIPSTKLPPKYSNPLDEIFNGNPGLRLKSEKSAMLPVRCFDQIFGYAGGKAKVDIKIRWHYDDSSSNYNHMASGELYTKIKKGKCGEDGFFVDGLDGSSECCKSFDAYVIDWECIYCPDEKPYLAYITSLTSGESQKEIAFELGEPPYLNNSAELLIPCQTDVMKAEFDISNERSLTNESEFFSTVLLTDVSGSMNWRFDSSLNGVNRDCTDDSLFDTTTRRIALARCAQTGISNNDTTFDGMITKLLEDFGGNRIGLVTFSSSAAIKSYLSNNIASLNSVVSTYIAGGSTNIEDGLRSSVDVLQTDNPNNNNYIILVSDGREWIGDSDAYVCGLEFPDNIAVYTLGIGPPYFFQEGFEGDCDYAQDPIACWTLQNIASCSNGTAYSAMTPESIIAALEEIIGLILHYPSNINILGIQYTGLLKGTYQEPDYLDPKPNITQLTQTFSDGCSGTDNMILTTISDSQGYVKVSDIDIRACSASEYP